MTTESPTVKMNVATAGKQRSTGFGSALRYEWINLSTLRSTWVLSGLVVLLQIVYTIFDDRADTPGAGQFSSQLSLLTIVTSVLVAAIGVNAFGAEYRHRTIATTVLTLRSRMSVVLAKAVVVAAIGAVTGLLAVLVDYLGVLVIGGTTVNMGDVAGAGLAALIYVVLSGLVGLALAGLTRHAVVALGLVIVWPGILEPLLAQALDLDPVAFPFLALRSLARVSAEPEWYLALPLVSLTAVLIAGTVVALSRRDA